VPLLVPPPARIRLGRLAYRVAYVGLRAWSAVVRPHTRGVKCIVVDGGDVLLVRHSYGPAVWDLPGGFCRRGESFARAIRRELGEELGLPEGAAVTDLGEVRRRMHGRHETLRAFRVLAPGRRVAAQSVEIAATCWFSSTALPNERTPLVDELLTLDSRFGRDQTG
jgi:ADP-ribose pyrophosphatase YjhB (NUDIX family)